VPFFSKFFGRTVGEGAGVAMGTATANVVEPALQELANAAREAYPHLPLDPQDAAALRARETTGEVAGIDLRGVDPSHEARYSGLRQARFDALTELARGFPDLGSLLHLRRRQLAEGAPAGIDRRQFRRALRHSGLEAEYIDQVTELLYERLAPADVANAIQQGFVPNDGYLPPADLTGPPFSIPTEQVAIDPTAEAFNAGVDGDRLRVLAQLSGNPPGPQELTEMFRRGLISEAQWLHGIREGRTKTKWAGPLFALRHAILSAADAANLRLRGWIDADEAARIGALTGYSAEQMQLQYEMRGRPISPTQAYTAWARDAPHVRQPGFDPAGPDFGEDDFLRAVRQSDIRPEWGPILWHNRFAYPSLFQLRRAVQDGGISRDRALTILRYERFERQDALALVDSWLTGTGTTAKGLTATDLATEYEGLYIGRPAYLSELESLGYSAAQAAAKADASDARRTRRYRDAAIERIHKRYDVHRASQDETRNALAGLDLPGEAIDLLLTLWTFARDEKVAVLTPAQVKKAWKSAILDRPAALSELEDRGYTVTDAATYLDE
jgi:hypothetical protein